MARRKEATIKERANVSPMTIVNKILVTVVKKTTASETISVIQKIKKMRSPRVQ